MPLYEYSLHQWASSYPTAKEDLIPGFMRRILPIYQGIHREGVVHRDVKPQNIMFHRGEWKIIDFGLATFYVDDQFRHIPATTTPHVHLVGTPKYASRNVHDGYDSTRRDDLISLGYVLLFLLYGDRMWDAMTPSSTGTRDPTHAVESTHVLYPNNLRLRECKSLENLQTCLPSPLYSYFEYVYSLTFAQTPNYEQLASIWSTVG
jgi:serine/threonine protein kinase